MSARERVTRTGEKAVQEVDKTRKTLQAVNERAAELKERMPKVGNLKEVKADAPSTKIESVAESSGKQKINPTDKMEPPKERLQPRNKLTPEEVRNRAKAIARNRLKRKLTDNKAVNFVKNHKVASGTALGFGLALSNSSDDSDTDQSNENIQGTEQQNPTNPGFVIGQDGNPYYYNGSGYIGDFIQGSDGDVYSSDGQLLGNVGNNMRSAGYNDIFDYNVAMAGIDPSKVAQIQQLLGITPDGKWGIRTQAAYQNYLQQIKNYNSGIPYTIYTTTK